MVTAHEKLDLTPPRPNTVESPSLSQLLNRFAPPEFLHSGMHAKAETIVRYGYRIASLNLLVPQFSASEVLHMQATTRLPRTPVWLLGMLNLRGNLLPLFDMRRVLGLDQAAKSLGQYVLVLGKGSQALGIVVDAQPQALKSLLPSASIPPVHERLRPHVSNCQICDEQLWLEFHHDSFFEQLAGNSSASQSAEP